MNHGIMVSNVTFVNQPTRTKTILYLITRSNWGGAQRYVYDLAHNLDQTHYNVVVAGGGTGAAGAPPGQLHSRLQAIGIPFQYLTSLQRSINPLQELRAMWQIWRCVRTVRPDVIHLNSSKMTILGSLLARLAGIRTIVVTVHGFPYITHQPRLIQWLATFITSLSFLCATNIICIAQADLAYAKTFRSARGKIHLIPNGIDTSQPILPGALARQRLQELYPALQKVNSNTPLLATGTELHPRKGIATVLHASAACITRGYSFHLCIIGTGQQKIELTRQVKQLKIENHVSFLGFVPDLPTLSTSFAGFILASYKEGLPYSLLELGAAGVPLIASKIDGIPDIISNDTYGQLIDPHKTETVTAALERLLVDPKQSQQYAQKLQTHILRHFSLEQMVEHTAKIYDSTIK